MSIILPTNRNHVYSHSHTWQYEIFYERRNKTLLHLQKTNAKIGTLRLSRRSVYKLAVDFNEWSQLLLRELNNQHAEGLMSANRCITARDFAAAVNCGAPSAWSGPVWDSETKLHVGWPENFHFVKCRPTWQRIQSTFIYFMYLLWCV
jgi:hypothetical protein